MNNQVSFIQEGKVSQISVPENILTEVKPTFLSQALHIYRSNQSRNISNSKNRAEVSGTGKKPWKQKGTGRARHGSMRSPIWIGGGITFGPTNLKNNSKKSTAKQRILALKMLCTIAINDKKMLIVDEIPNFKKTKEASNWLATLPIKAGFIALIISDSKVKLAFNNLSNVSFESVVNPDLGRLSRADWIVISKADLDSIAGRDRVTKTKIVEASPKTTKKVEK